MIATLDVDYRGDTGVAACVVASGWSDDKPSETHVRATHPVAAYESGHFYKRELPCLLDVLHTLTATPDVVIVDGYTCLDGGKDGLGAHLYRALGSHMPVVGVAKTRFHEAVGVVEVQRGSTRPLYVSAIGLDVNVAAEAVRRMHGPYRLPTLLKLVDGLCRTASV